MDKCPSCGEKFKHLSMHWQHQPQHLLEITSEMHEIIKGSLMSDGSLHRSSKNPCLAIEMTNKKYLQHLNKKLGVLSTGLSLKNTSETNAKRARKSGFRPNAKAKNYKKSYYLNTRRHPELKKYEKWYTSGSKVWPQHINLTPIILKHLYSGDGNMEKSKNYYRLSISMRNESENKDKVESYFTEQDLPPPDYWSEYEGRTKARWNKKNAKKLFDYMGEAPPGFEYKWP